jgi:hypothetical protein
MPHADFSYSVDEEHQLIRLVDVGHTYTKSVTNDAERVADDLVAELGDLSRWTVLYQDSSGTWDELVVESNHFAGFRPGPRDDREELI